MKPYPYQQKIIETDTKYTGLWLGCGTGKTFIAISMAEGDVLVVCPKTIRDDKVWERQLEKMNNHRVTKITVFSKEEFKVKANTCGQFDTVIIDEAHTVAGLTPNIRYVKKEAIPKSSQLFEICQTYLKNNPPKRLYLCTATPIKSPMSVLALAWLLGKQFNFYEWRNAFMIRLPVSGRAEIWAAKKDKETKNRLAKAVQSLGFTGRLCDFTDVPTQTHVTKHIPLSDGQKKAIQEATLLYPDPIVLLGKKHQIEQGVLKGDEFSENQQFDSGKLDEILTLTEQYEKVLVFAKYTAQVSHLEKEISKTGINVYTLTGQTKDRRDVIRQAEENERCVVICQSQISAGYELPSFRCTVFASESYSITDHEQSIGRSLRMNKLAPNLYVYLVSGTIDKAVRDSLSVKKDFSERVFLKL